MNEENAHNGDTVPSPNPTRTKASWKPRIAATPLPFFRSGDAVLLGIDDGAAIERSGEDRSPETMLPYSFHGSGAYGGERIAPSSIGEIGNAPAFSPTIVGGLNGNALEVRWESHDGTACIRWFALKTFVGIQVHYVVPGAQQPIVFAFAGDDAYAYCDKNPCEECSFHCKRGFELYACIENHGIVVIPLHERVDTVR